MPYDLWRPANLTKETALLYKETLAQMEPVIKLLCNWAYMHYGTKITTVQVCVIMLRWGLASTAEEAYFLAGRIQAFQASTT